MKWTQDEAIAFECACEAITHLRAIYTAERYHSNPTPERLVEIEAELRRLYDERLALHVDSHAEIARIRSEYGAIIRAWNEAARYDDAVT